MAFDKDSLNFVLLKTNGRSFFIKVVAGLILGVLCSDCWHPHSDMVYWAVVASVALSTLYLLAVMCGILRYRTWLSAFCVFLISFQTGAYLSSSSRQPQVSLSEEEPRILTLRLSDYPIERQSNYLLSGILLNSSSAEDSVLFGRQILLFVKKDTSENSASGKAGCFIDSLGIGKVLMAHSRLEPVVNALYEQDKGLGFNYNKYLARSGYFASAYLRSSHLAEVGHSVPQGIIEVARVWRRYLTELFAGVGIDKENRAVLSAITLGDKAGLSYGQKQDFSAAGASHILVVSGMHVGYLYAIVMLIISMLPSRRGRVVMALMGLCIMWCYAVLAGLSPSVVRAAFMSSLLLFMQSAGLYYQVRNAIALSAIVLIIEDCNVVFDIGFQLSYSAVVSIIYFVPLLNRMIHAFSIKSKILRMLVMVVNVALSAQILTAPLVLYHFGQFPVMFIATNFFVTLFAPILFIGGLLLLAVAPLGAVGAYFGMGMNYAVSLFSYIIHFISSLPYALMYTYINELQCVALYLLVWVVAETTEMFLLVGRRRLVWLWTSFASLILVVVLFCESNVYFRQKSRLTVTDDFQLLVSVVSPKQNVVFTDLDSMRVEASLRSLWLKHSALKPQYAYSHHIEDNYFCFGGESFLILRENSFKKFSMPDTAFAVDNLIVARGVYPFQRLSRFVKPRRIVLTNGVWRDNVERFKEEFSDTTISWHIVKSDGPFVVAR